MTELTNDPNQTIGAGSLITNEPAVALEPGMLLNNKYELIEQIGRGGMGVVWKARDRVAERLVALKFVPRDLQRFEAEMQRARDTFGKVHALNHQSICPLYGLEDGGVSIGHYLVMKYLEGETLNSFVHRYDPKQKGLAFNKVTALLARVAHALDYAHKHEVIHRDIKPSNIFLVKTANGYEVQVIDFGLAEEIKSSLTRVSQITFDVTGTRPYMAPEQWRGRHQTAATDQYALAVVAYELLSGHLPFEGNDLEMLRLAVMQDTPEPIRTIPPNANAAIQRALSKDAVDRFESCSAFVKAMESPFVDLTPEEETQSEDEPQSKLSQLLMSRPPLWVSLCVALVLALLMTVLFTSVVWGARSLMRSSPGVINDVINNPLGQAMQREANGMNGDLPYQSSFEDIFEATENGTVADVRYFIETKGIDVNSKDGSGWTLLLRADGPNSNIEVLKYLIKKGADVNAQANGLTPLHHAVSTQRIEVLKCLIDNGADVNAKITDHGNNWDGWTPLHSAVAVDNHNVEVLKCLIDNGADVNAKNVRDETPLHVVVHHNSKVEKLKFMLENGADVNAKADDGWTPLHHAAHYGYDDNVMKILVDYGADVNAKANDGRTPLDIARYIKTKESLRNMGGQSDALTSSDPSHYISSFKDIFDAALSGTVEDVKYFVENGVDVNMRNTGNNFHYSFTVLHFAARYNRNVEVLKYLIDNGAEVNAKGINSDLTPLHFAAQNNSNLEVLEYLIEKGANVNAVDQDGETPHDIADTEEKKIILREAGGKSGREL